jgi:hypothetical protein
VIRCNHCKTAIRIPNVDSPLLQNGNLVECRATLAIKLGEAAPAELNKASSVVDNNASHQNSIRELSPNSQVLSRSPIADVPVQQANRVPLLRAKPWRVVEPLTEIDPDEPPSGEIKISPTTPAKVAAAPVATPAFKPVALKKLATIPMKSAAVADPDKWRQKLVASNTDRKTLVLLLSFCMVAVALLGLAPAIYYFQNWLGMEDLMPIPRWIYLQFFSSAVFLLYAIFLSMVQHWTSLRSVAVAMLVLAFAFGVASTALLFGEDGWAAGMLGIPFSLSRQACLWCILTLCLTTAISYWAGRESLSWQRAEKLINDMASASQ